MMQPGGSFLGMLLRLMMEHVHGSFIYDLGKDFKAAVRDAKVPAVPGVYLFRLREASSSVVYVGKASTSLRGEMALCVWPGELRERGIRRLHVEWIAAPANLGAPEHAAVSPAMMAAELLRAFREESRRPPEFNME